MREIKFRAWHKEEKRMYDRVLAATDYGVVTGNLWHDGELDADWKIWAISFFEIMQYTGLKDKNGIEIYEGDIVKQEGLELEVKWSDFYSGFVYEDWTGSSMDVTSGNSSGYEIIGNIYENPELLK